MNFGMLVLKLEHFNPNKFLPVVTYYLLVINLFSYYTRRRRV